MTRASVRQLASSLLVMIALLSQHVWPAFAQDAMISANPVTTPSVATGKPRVKAGIYSDSLWGNVLLNMAYQRDPQLAKLARKKAAINPFGFLVAVGIFGLDFAIGGY